MRNVSLIEFDMESHYKDSLSTAIVNILLQCGFENSSKRALDELIGMSLNYMKNITLKISNLTNECNLPETDILIGLGALKLHGHNLDELFDFVQNYNDIFPPPPKTYFGPIPLKSIEPKKLEEKPLGIVSWAPEMSSSLATIGMKLKNRQIVSDPNFDRSNYLALSLNSPPLKNSEYRTNDQSKSSINNMNSKIQKYGSNCSYELPPEAYPNKYEPPTIDLDSNGAVIGLNGKIGKLPDPFINDIEEQDLLRQKSKFHDINLSKLSYSNHQLFNGVRQRKLNKSTEEISKRLSTPNRSLLESTTDEEMKENISKIHNNQENSPCPYLITNDNSLNYKPNHQVDRNAISDDVWNAALQATVDQSELFISTASSIVTSISTSLPTNTNDSLAQSIKSSKKAKKHKRNSSFSSSRPKKTRKIEVGEKIVEIDSQVCKNESTMDSYVSDRSVPYSSPSDREQPLYNRNDQFREQATGFREKSPSYSPINNFVPADSMYYQTEIIPSSPPTQSVTKPFKAKKKSSRKTHFSNKRKKKSFYPSSTVGNNFCSMVTNHHQQHNPHEHQQQQLYHHHHHQQHHIEHNSSNRTEFNDNASISQRSLSINYDNRSNTPLSPHPPVDTCFEDSDDDRTEPMVESSEELIKMLEMTDDTIRRGRQHQQPNSVHAIESPPPSPPSLQQPVNSNQQNTRINIQNQHDTHNPIANTPGLSGTAAALVGGGGGSSGGIRMKIKFRKSKNSIVRGASSIVNSNTDLSSPIQSQHSDDKNSISERLQLMQYHSPLSDIDEARHPHSSFDKSSNHSNYGAIQPPHSPAYSSMQESPMRDLYRFDNSVASVGAGSSTFSKPPTPNKLIIRPSNFGVIRFNSSSTHSSPKTLPALDDCDKVPNLQLKTSKSVKKRKRSRLSSGSKKVKSKKSVKLKPNHEQQIQKPMEKPFVSVDDIFSDEDDIIIKSEPNHFNTVSVNNSRPSISDRPPIIHQSQLPLLISSPPHGIMSIPSVNSINSKSSVKKSSKSKHKSINTAHLPAISQIENKTTYNYPCLPGEAHYTSEDGKLVYICPICSGEDDGFLMLGCERCEDWYHGRCLKVYNPPPEDQDWFCQRCLEDMLKGSQNKGNSKSNSKSRTKKK